MHAAVWSVIEMAVLIATFVGLYVWLLKPNLLRTAQLENDLRLQELETAHVKAVHAFESEKNRREADLDFQRAKLVDLERDLIQKQEDVIAGQLALREREAEQMARLETLAGMTKEAAQEALRQEAKAQIGAELERWTKSEKIAAEARLQSEVREHLLTAMERAAAVLATEATVSHIALPSEDWKGRLIGREGRNIRAFEHTTGVDLIIDDAADTISVSTFDPARRAVATMTLEKLLADGRVHPVRIEELYAEAQMELSDRLRNQGIDAAERARVAGLAEPVIDALGALSLRASYAQNVLEHSVETAYLAGHLAEEMGLNADMARRAALLHDIGKALSEKYDGPHAIAGRTFLAEQGEVEPILNAVGAHHHDIEPDNMVAHLVIVADSLSAARPGARRESLANYIKRLAELEQIANRFPGVERSYAIQAGREVRVFVHPEEVDDPRATNLATAIAEAIEKEQSYSGSIKVTVIREFRASANTNEPIG